MVTTMPGTGIMVRRLAPNDVELFRAVRLAGLQDSPNAFGESFEIAQESDWHARTVSGSTLSDRAVYVALSGDRAVGMVFVKAATAPAPAFLGGMWVAPLFRRHGVGRSLIEQALEFLRAARQVKVSLWVTSSHDDVARFYEGLGFSRTGETSSLRDGSDLEIFELTRTLVASAD